MHTMFMVVREPGRRLTNCPTDRLKVKASGWQQPARVLDLGCGTAIWMLEMAQRFRHAEFLGVDLHRMGPASLEENVVYTAPWDYTGPWAMGEKSWDMIHLQMALGSVSNWQDVYQKILDHLIPGTGWFESVELDFQPRFEGKGEERLPGMLTDWWDLYIKGSYEVTGRHLHYNPATPEILKRMGFKDVKLESYKIPLNEWHGGQAEDRAAAWWQVAMGPGADGNGGYGLEAMSLRPLCAYSNWSPDHVRRLCIDALAEASKPDLRPYNLLHVLTARAPGPDER